MLLQLRFGGLQLSLFQTGGWAQLPTYKHLELSFGVVFIYICAQVLAVGLQGFVIDISNWLLYRVMCTSKLFPIVYQRSGPCRQLVPSYLQMVCRHVACCEHCNRIKSYVCWILYTNKELVFLCRSEAGDSSFHTLCRCWERGLGFHLFYLYRNVQGASIAFQFWRYLDPRYL